MRLPNPKSICRRIVDFSTRYILNFYLKNWSDILILYAYLFQEGYATWIADNHNEFENLTVPWTVVGRKPIPDWLRVSSLIQILKWQNIISWNDKISNLNTMLNQKRFQKVSWIQSHHLQWKFKLWTGKFSWGEKAKHCWSLSTNIWK